MTDPREPAEPPAELSVDLLADLDAGLLEPAEAAEVRAAAARDPQAPAVLAALDTTRAELGALADPPVPAQYAGRWEAALAAAAAGAASQAEAGPTLRAEGADTAAPGPLPPLRPSAGRRRLAVVQLRRVRPALVAAVVLAAAVIGGVVWTPREHAPLSLEGVDLATAGLAVRGDFDVGRLTDSALRAGCLSAVAPAGVSPDAPLLGGRDVLVDGRHGVLLLLAGGGPGHLHVVVVEPGCGPEGGVLLGTRTIGG